MRFGVLLPHFGSGTSAEAVANVATAADNGGFDSVWVRDHLKYEPHGMEDSDPTFFEAFTTLAYCSAITRNVSFGTAAAIPFRHPLVLAKMLSTLTNLSGRMLTLGIGAGLRNHEFASVGQISTIRSRAESIVPETIEILRGAWGPEPYAHQGKHWSFDEIDMHPKPAVTPNIWYCGISPLSVRVAKGHCTGWVPGRITFDTLQARAEEWAGPVAADGGPLSVAVIPLVSLADTRERALERVQVGPLLEYANNHRWLQTADGRPFTTADDLAGLLLAGTPDDVIADVKKYVPYGVSDVIFDLRLAWDKAPQDIEQLGKYVLPAIRSWEHG